MTKRKTKPLHNILALLLMLGIGAALYGRISFEEQANNLVGPDFIRTDGEHLLVHNKGSIYLLDKFGNDISNITLKQLDFPGKLADMQLLDKKTFLLGNQTDKKIYQCTLSTSTCSLFADLSKHVKDFYKFYYDGQTKITLISDTDHHQILKFDNSSGDISIISTRGDFKYPNDLILQNNTLFVTDTNHHRIAAYHYENYQLGELKFEALGFTEHTTKNWPTAFTIDDNNNIWVLIANGVLHNPEIIKYDGTGKVLDKVTPEGVSDLSFITHINETIYVTDQGDSRIFTIEVESSASSQFSSGKLQDALRLQQQHKTQLKDYSMLMLVAIVVMFIIAIVIASSSYKNEDKLTPSLRYERRKQLHKKLDKMLWLTPNRSLHKKIRLLSFMIIILTVLFFAIALLTFNMLENYNDEAIAHLVKYTAAISIMIIILIFFIFITVRYTLRQHLGTDGFQLLIAGSKKTGYRSDPDNVIYTNTHIAIPQASIMFKNLAGIYFFDEDQFRQHVQPLLNMYGKRVGNIRMFIHQLTHFHPIAYINLLLMVISIGMLYIITQN